MKRKSNKGESPTRVFDKLRIQYCEEGEKSLEIDLPQLIVDFDQFYQKYFKINSLKSFNIDFIVPKDDVLTFSSNSLKLSKLRASNEFSECRQCVGDNPSPKTKKVIEKLFTCYKGMMELTIPKGENSRIYPNNAVLQEIVDNIEVIFFKTADVLSSIQVWVKLQRPPKEDGNNYYIGILDECIELAAQTETNTMSFIDLISKINSDRSEAVKTLLEQPWFADNHLAVDEMDGSTYLAIRNGLKELRNDYIVLYRTLIKSKSTILGISERSNDLLY